MPARKTKKASVKKVATRSKKSNSGLRSVHLVMIGIVAAVVVAGYLFFQNNIQSPTSPANELKATVDVESSNFSDDQIQAKEDDESVESSDDGRLTLVAQNGSKQSGSVTVEDVEDQAVVNVRLYGSTEPKQSAHIHYGSCEYPGEVKYPLTDLADGASKTTLDISKQELLWGLPLAVMVHTSSVDDTVVACADITN